MTARERTRYSGTPEYEVVQISNSGTGTCAVPYPPASASYTYWYGYDTLANETMQDVVTPLYKKLSAAGIVINNPMQYVKTVERNLPYTFSYNHVHRWWDTSCTPDKWVYCVSEQHGQRDTKSLADANNVSFLTLPYVDVSELINLATVQAYSNIGRPEVYAGVTILEAGKTVNSLCSIFYRLARILRAARKLRILELARELRPKELARRWLELRYALRPLVYDLRGSLDAVQALRGPDPYDSNCDALSTLERVRKVWRNPRFTARGTSSYRGYDEDLVEKVVYGQGGFSHRANLFFKRTATSFVQVRVGAYCSVEEVSALDVLGLRHVSETAWELLPFSFIVDWFFNVGEALAAWNPEEGITQLASWVSVTRWDVQRVTVTREHTCTSSGGTNECNAISAHHSGGMWELTTTTRTRVPVAPLAQFPTVSFRQKLNFAKLADLILIARQSMR